MRVVPTGTALLLGVCTALLASAPVSGEIYRWTDAEGRLHFTQSLDKVPPQHRAAARRSAQTPSAERVSTYSGSPGAAAAAAPRALRASGGEVEIPFVLQGNVMRVEAVVNDRVRVPFLIDTGASGVSLPSAYAEQLGIRVRGDTPYRELHTANGVVARPLVEIESVQLGGARVEGLSATLNPAMQIGLLGGSFFNNFIYRVDAARGVITLAPNAQIRAGLGQDQWRQRFQQLREPLDRLDAYLREHTHLPAAEQRELEQRRSELETALLELEREANRLDVPQVWRY